MPRYTQTPTHKDGVPVDVACKVKRSSMVNLMIKRPHAKLYERFGGGTAADSATAIRERGVDTPTPRPASRCGMFSPDGEEEVTFYENELMGFGQEEWSHNVGSSVILFQSRASPRETEPITRLGGGGSGKGCKTPWALRKSSKPNTIPVSFGITQKTVSPSLSAVCSSALPVRIFVGSLFSLFSLFSLSHFVGSLFSLFSLSPFSPSPCSTPCHAQPPCQSKAPACTH